MKGGFMRFFSDQKQSSVDSKDIELNRLALKDLLNKENIYLGGGSKGEWIHAIFDNEGDAKQASSLLLKEEFVERKPNVNKWDSSVAKKYPEDTYFIRIHQSAYPEIASKCGLPEKDNLDVYPEEAPAQSM